MFTLIRALTLFLLLTIQTTNGFLWSWWTQPKALSYGESNYKQVVGDAAVQFDSDSVKASLPTARARREFDEIQTQNLGIKCVQLWTAESGKLYQYVKNAIVKDDIRKLTQLRPYLQCLEHFIRNGNGHYGQGADPHHGFISLFRGSKMSAKQQAKYIEGSFVTMASFFSTSLKRRVATQFATPSGVMIEVRVPVGYPWARSLMQYR